MIMMYYTFIRRNNVIDMAKRAFYDSYILMDIAKAKDFLLLAKHLGYNGVGVRILSNEISLNSWKRLIEISSLVGIDTLLRLNEEEQNVYREFLKKGFKAITSVDIKSEKDFREKIRHRSVRVLSFNFIDFMKVITKETLNIIKQYPDKFIEIRIIDLLNAQRKERALALNALYKKIKLLNNKHLRLIISTGARRLNDLVSPRCIRSFLKLVGINENRILDFISENPKAIFEMPARIIVIED